MLMRRYLPIIAALLLVSCTKEPERWTAFVYPPGKAIDSDNVHRAIHGQFSTFEDCQTAAIGSLRQHLDSMTYEQIHELGEGDYECGVGCRFESKHGLYMCKETRK